MKNRVLKLWLFGAALVIGGGATAYAVQMPIPTPTGTVYACFHQSSGKMYLRPNETALCKRKYIAFEWEQGGGSSTELPRTIFVPSDGTPVDNGNALLAAAAATTGDLDRPHTLQLDDGEYDVGGTTINLSGVVLQGRNTERTIVQGAGSALFDATQGGVLRTDSDVRNLTIRNIGGGATYAGGIVFVGTAGTIANVNVDVSNATNSYGVWNVMGTVSVREVRVSSVGSTLGVGVRHDNGGLGARTRMWDSKIGGSSDALLSEGGTARITGSVLAGGSLYANVLAGSVVLRNNALAGASSGSLDCRASSTGSSFFTTTCPAEFWSVTAD